MLPGAGGRALWVGIVVANYLCGLACMTSTSRMMYAFARDGGLPGSGALKRVSPRWGTPVNAIWTTAALALASTLYAPAYSTLTTACVIFLYLSYVMPTLVGLRAYGRSWTRFGPFDLGAPLYKTLAVVSVLGAALLVWIGVQPPNEKALTVAAGDDGGAARRLVAGRAPPFPRPAGDHRARFRSRAATVDAYQIPRRGIRSAGGGGAPGSAARGRGRRGVVALLAQERVDRIFVRLRGGAGRRRGGRDLLLALAGAAGLVDRSPTRRARRRSAVAPSAASYT